MAQEVTNFARFYALFNKLPFNGDREEFKKSIVLQYTWNRTDSLREMTRLEYKTCCEGLEKLAGVDERRQKMQEELKYWRSVCLRLMQKIVSKTHIHNLNTHRYYEYYHSSHLKE